MQDLHAWIMLMQVWGAHSGTQPHLSLAESRHKAHTLLMRCHNELQERKTEIQRLFNDYHLFNKSSSERSLQLLKPNDDFMRMKIEDEPNCELRLLMSITHTQQILKHIVDEFQKLFNVHTDQPLTVASQQNDLLMGYASN